jgi:hypothetical protein
VTLSPIACAFLEADLRSTDARPSLPADGGDRALELALRTSIRRNAWRAAAGLPLRADPQHVARWHAFLNYRFWLAKYRRRHPITTPAA